MGISVDRQELIDLLDDLTDEQVSLLIQFIRAIQTGHKPSATPYHAHDDPLVGFISGPTDVAAHVEDILYEDIDPQSGWTQKPQGS
jgi:hypothetical protein